VIALSHRRDNVVMAALVASLGFVPWQIDASVPITPGEVYVCLLDRS